MEPSLARVTPISSGTHEGNASGVSWSAVLAGTFVTAALALILLALGSGLGIASLSPWGSSNSTAIAAGAVIWLIVVELLSSALGGYIAGRMRMRWTSVHSDEVYFRDTTHGLLAWSVALVITAAFLTSAATTLTGSAVASPTTASSSQSRGPASYFVDSMFRSSGGNVESAANRIEADTIFANGLREGALPTADRNYLGSLVAAKSGIASSEGTARVDDAFNNAQVAAEKTKKAVAKALIWTFIALLIGAFSASFAATIGGRQRDNVILL